MRTGKAKIFAGLRISVIGFVFAVPVMVAFLFVADPCLCNAQEVVKVQSIASEFVREPGSPVEVTLAKTELDLDPFNAPVDARIYVTYRNLSDRQIQAVKFRLRFTDGSEKDRGTFHADDVYDLGPGGQRDQKWRHERIDPRTTQLKIRVLQVKYADGSVWQSAKMQELGAQSNGANGGASMGQGSGTAAETAIP